MLDRIGVSVVSIESDKAIIAFRDDIDLTSFRDAVSSYEDGPQSGINPTTGRGYASTQWDILEFIEAPQMRLWGRDDRIGIRLQDEIGDETQAIDDDRLYRVDVELWHRGTVETTRTGLREVRQLVEHDAQDGERVGDEFIGQLLCLARVSVRGAKLNQLLDLDSVAEVDLPAQPHFDQRQARRVTERELPTPAIPQPGGPSVCVVDSGTTSNHPLLANNIGHAEAVLTNSTTVADEHGHGTMVGGLAVFGNIRACYESGEFSSPITLFSARVLNDENRFDDETLIIHQMRRAIEVFYASPYNCRVFNISLGINDAWLQHNDRQSLWAESLDILAREYNVCLVVSAGNHSLGLAFTADDAEEVVASYPEYLFHEECGLCEPATAAIPITVGAIAAEDTIAIPVGRREDDLNRPIAEAFQPSPTTRFGPGIGGAIKPEFVAPGGNTTFQGFSSLRQVDDDPGLAVMSFSNEPTQELFAFDIGTSYAASVVARSASLLWSHVHEQFGEEPQANLIRALLASSASVPDPTYQLLHDEHGEEGIRRACGYGLVDDDFAFDSGDRRVTLIHQGSMPLDTFAVYEVPAPLEFRQAEGHKHVTIAMAFDPPVRRRRASYLGVHMSYALIRGKSVDEIVEAYRQLSTEEREQYRESGTKPQGAFQGAFRCDLKPGPQSLQSSTLQKSRWTFSRENTNYGDSWYVVVQSQRVWAPESFVEQKFAITVTLQADEPHLYNLIQNRIRVRQQQRTRARV
ncbi:S8 family peptidase [Rhodopirellula sp. P2]|uniref:S8 family peptidase n=1 Tax=Rhodopirellula sp. P2 TaxID=2127060 RepID=UPI0023687E36|nr:S8 family peptidase [Rhodopirellula sp. P2]WDQ19091.1 S8 family peptidase [Rhodopirellula sp. P2]